MQSGAPWPPFRLNSEWGFWGTPGQAAVNGAARRRDSERCRSTCRYSLLREGPQAPLSPLPCPPWPGGPERPDPLPTQPRPVRPPPRGAPLCEGQAFSPGRGVACPALSAGPGPHFTQTYRRVGTPEGSGNPHFPPRPGARSLSGPVLGRRLRPLPSLQSLDILPGDLAARGRPALGRLGSGCSPSPVPVSSGRVRSLDMSRGR